MDSTERAFAVFLATRDPVKVAAERTPPFDVVKHERPKPEDRRSRAAEVDSMKAAMEAEKQKRRLNIALMEVRAIHEKQLEEARRERAFLINQAKYRRAA